MDFDADGLEDIVSGSYSPGHLYVFRRQTDGTYARSEKILDRNGKPVDVGNAATSYLVDWDGDGDLDLVVGNIKGEVWYVPNEGTRDKPEYGNAQPLEADGKHVVVAGDAGPVVADWDGDGRLDLLVGSGDGSVLLYRNTSDDKAQPMLAAATTLLPPSAVMGRAAAAEGAEEPARGLRHGIRTKPHVADYNGDGKLDLLVGDFSYFESKKDLTDEQRQMQQRAQQRLQELTDEQQKLSAAPDGETPEARRERLRALRDIQREIIDVSRQAMAMAPARRFEQHGYVWLYLRKEVQKTAAAQGSGG